MDDQGRRDESASPAISESLKRSSYEFNTHPVVRLTDTGIDWGRWPEPGDEVGYGMHPYRGDDCMQAAIATCTQVPIEQVPDLALDRRFEGGEDRDEISRTAWERIAQWAQKRGLTLGFSETVPLPLDRWIGVVEWKGNAALPTASERFWQEVHKAGDDGQFLLPFQDHCLVMSHDRLVFDPSCSVRKPPGATGKLCFDPTDVSYGIAFVKEE